MSPRTPTQVDLARLQQLIAAYGSRPDRWPEEERDCALRLLQSHPELQGDLDTESSLDAWLDLAPNPAPSDELVTRVLAAAPQPRHTWVDQVNRWAGGLWPVGRNLQPVFALAAAAILGVATGLLTPNSDANADPWDSESSALDDEFDDGELP